MSNATDILEELNLTAVARQVEMPLPVMPLPMMPEDPDAVGAESDLLRHLNDEPLHIDDIRRIAKIPISAVSSLLTMLELKGLVRQVGCMHYVRMREVSPIYGS